jgi:hypothetical protein
MPQFRHTEHYYGKRYKDTENKYAGSEVGAVTRQMSGLMACLVPQENRNAEE